MKYLKITSGVIFGTDNLTQNDLVKIKERVYDAIVNRISEEYFDVDENKWKPIPNIDEPVENF